MRSTPQGHRRAIADAASLSPDYHPGHLISSWILREGLRMTNNVGVPLQRNLRYIAREFMRITPQGHNRAKVGLT